MASLNVRSGKDKNEWSRVLQVLKSKSAGLMTSLLAGIASLSFSGANAQVVFTDTSGGSALSGDWVLGSSFGTWSTTIADGPDPVADAISPANADVAGDGIQYRYNEGNPWNLVQTFTLAPDSTSSPDALFRLVLQGNAGYGGNSADNPNSRFGSRFGDYSLQFSPANPGESFVFSDPDGQLASTNAAAGTWVQQDATLVFPAGDECIVGSGPAIRNFCLTWEVISPSFGGGPATMTLEADNGALLEGFRFSLISIANIEVEKSASPTDPLNPGDQGFFDIVVSANSDSGAFSNATNVALLDLLPPGALLDTTQGGGDGWEIVDSSNPGATLQDGGSYDPSTGDWTIGTVAIGGSVTLRLFFTADASAVTFDPDTNLAEVTNDIDPSTIVLDQQEADVLAGNPITDGPLEASFEIAGPSIELVKSVSSVLDTSGNGIFGDAGDTVNYEFFVENTGETALAAISVTDTGLAALTGTATGPTVAAGFDGDLAVDEGPVLAATATYVLTDTDVSNGSVTNTATTSATAVDQDVSGNPLPGSPLPGLGPVEDDSDTGSEAALDSTDGTVPPIGDPAGTDSDGTGGTDAGDNPTVLTLPAPVPSISLEKSITDVVDTNTNGIVGDAGDTVNFLFQAENTGNTALADLVVTDDDLAALDGAFTLSPLTPTAAFDFNSNGQFDLPIGSGLVDVATATYVLAASDITRGSVTNQADVTSTAVATDASGNPNPSSPLGLPAVEDTSDTGTEPDLDENGDPVDIGDPANSDGNGDASTGSSDDATVLNLPAPEPGIELVKSAIAVLDDVIDAPISLRGFIGDTITYEFVVTNTGNTALANVGITDTKLGLTNALVTVDPPVGGRPAGALLPGETGILTFDYTILPQDVAAGFAENTATTSGQPVGTDPATGEPTTTALTDPSTGNAFDPVEDISDTGSEERPDELTGDIVEITDPAGTDSNGTAGDDADEPTIVAVPFLAIPDEGLVISKAVSDGDTNVILGDTVPYTITVENTSAVVAGFLDVVDTLPVGMTYIPGTAAVDGVPVTTEPTVSGLNVIFEDQLLPPGSSFAYTVSTRVDASAPVGDLTNTATMRDPVTGARISNIATATVSRDPEAVFDCAPVIGKVFDDINMDGYQNHPDDRDGTVTDQVAPFSGKIASDGFDSFEEPGLAGARVVTPTGTVITTDEHGRFSVPCAELPGSLGTNFTLKLDTRSLPTGYRVTTENPRTMRLTGGILTELNFGAAIGRLLDVDLTAAAFDQDEPVQRLEQGLERLLREIADTPGVIKLTYFRGSESERLAQTRLDEVEDFIERRWSSIGRYRLIVEQTIVNLQ